jgi:hypothetical protein
MESKIDQTPYDEIDNTGNIELNEEKRVGSLGCHKVVKQIVQNRRICKTDYDKSQNCKPIKGDLIQIKRVLYDHWAVYVGDGEVIHVCDVGEWKATIRRDLLKDVCGKSLCRINNLEEAAQKRGLKPRSVDAILKYAYTMLNEKFEYDPIENNCEHFATCCRFGSPFSEQALATERDSTGFTEIVVQVGTKVIIGTKSIMDDLMDD